LFKNIRPGWKGLKHSSLFGHFGSNEKTKFFIFAGQEFMNSIKKYDSDVADQEANPDGSLSVDDVTKDIFRDDGISQDSRGGGDGMIAFLLRR
jgi:hypothetical protein